MPAHARRTLPHAHRQPLLRARVRRPQIFYLPKAVRMGRTAQLGEML
jgi:hypothetical protein